MQPRLAFQKELSRAPAFDFSIQSTQRIAEITSLEEKPKQAKFSRTESYENKIFSIDENNRRKER